MARGTTKCIGLSRGRVMRVTRLDGCGRPVFSDASTVTSKGFVSVAYTANTKDSTEIALENADGSLGVHEPSETSLTGYGVEITFSNVDPEMLSLITDQANVEDADGNVIGFDVDTAVSLTAAGFGLEVWAGAPAGDACDTEGATGSFGYTLNPFIRGGILGDFTIGADAVSFKISGAQTRDGNAWGVGPYNDIMIGAGSVPGPMLTPVSKTLHLRQLLVDVAPPTPVCGARPLLDPSASGITAVSGTVTGSDVAFTVTPAATSPVWYDFGDGTWDYVAAPGSTSHTYDNPGTYTVRASANGVWVTTTVTIA